jgi:hypothetical protein
MSEAEFRAAFRALRDSYADLVAAIGVSSLTAERYTEAVALIRAADAALSYETAATDGQEALALLERWHRTLSRREEPAPTSACAPAVEPRPKPVRKRTRRLKHSASPVRTQSETAQERFARRLGHASRSDLASQAAGAAALFSAAMGST